MKLLVANHTVSAVGGVERYLADLVPVLGARGHDVAILTEDDTNIEGCRGFSTRVATFQRELSRWSPNVVFDNGISSPKLEEWLISRFPTVLFAHNYYGTCVSG